MSFSQKLSLLAGNVRLVARAKTPLALTIIGTGALVAAGALAAVKAKDAEPAVQEIAEALEGDAPVAQKLAKAAKPAGQVVRVFALPMSLATIGAASVLYSHNLLSKRYAGVVAAYGVLEQTFAEYRSRVARTVGDELEAALYEGHEVRIDKVSGKGDDRRVDGSVGDERLPSLYAFEFGPSNPRFNTVDSAYNLLFLRNLERWSNNKLDRQGHLFLNDVYDALGIPRTRMGAVVGWHKAGQGDGYISFRLPKEGSAVEHWYLKHFTGEEGLIIDPNVDGKILELLP